ncbi:MAG: hypothetical protein CM15mV149_100 [uncultured marine virus]|nr:MAG: hypothetical protein CM15mV149_100 [uncultured marine virus]
MTHANLEDQEDVKVLKEWIDSQTTK